MKQRALVTGGAGFIGSAVAHDLLARGYNVRALDALVPQVHGPERRRPAYLDDDVELQVGDVRDPAAVRRALVDVDVVYHFAARVGVGQSMYEITDYTSVNNLGTTVLLEALIEKPVERLVVASSMSVYGEGLYRDRQGRTHERVVRDPDALRHGVWDPRAPDGDALEPVPTPEHKPPQLASVYALSKYDQERLCLLVGATYKIPTVALRFFNVYGPHQALSNPYTGVLAIFAARLLNDKPPLLFEDGQQRRDFVHIRDIVQGCRLAREVDAAVGRVFNIGSGRAITVAEVAVRMARLLGKPVDPQVTGQLRVGDVRHCFADIDLAAEMLGFRPEVDLDVGMGELGEWLSEQLAVDRFDDMRADLTRRGLAL
jgi:dTDP-L-rhamnose 4-epimerase